MKTDLSPSTLGPPPPKGSPEYAAFRAAYMAEYRQRVKAAGRPLRDSPSYEENRAGRFKRYGLTEASFLSLLENQDNACAICRTPLDPNCKNRHTHIDHCHTTGKVRGVLCSSCNLGLGHFKDDAARLLAAYSYLKP